MTTWLRARRPVIAMLLAVALVGSAPANHVDAYSTVVYNGAGPAPRIGIIGDSTIAALRWTNTFGPLRRFNFVYDAESCRRTATASCRGREGYQPDNVISTMRRLSGRWGSVLVIMGGYDDPGFGFASAIDSVMAEASRQRIPSVMWLTLRTADVSYVGPTFRSNATTFRDNNRILLLKAAQYGSRLQIADWASYSAGRADWFYADGIHMRPSGALAAATYIADQAERVLGQINSGWPELRINASGRVVAEAQQAMMNAGIFVRGGATGRFDIYTYYAVRTFQRLNDLTITGYIDAGTARKLGLLGGEWRALRRGSSGDAVRRAQQALIDRGIFVRGGVTGVFDVYTHYAVQTFQRWQGLDPTGVIDSETARRLALHQAPDPDGVWKGVSLHDTGANVSRAQRALIDAGIFVRGGVSGTFDVYTWYAVNTFQRRHGLPVTGRVDPATAQALGLFDPSDPVGSWAELRLGSSGPFVAQAQRALMNRYIRVRGGVTGVFNLGTYYAVATFQRYNGLGITGRIDLATAQKLGLFDPVAASATILMSPMTVAAPATLATTSTTSTTTTSTTSTTVVPALASTTSATLTATTDTATTSPHVDAPAVLSGVTWFDADGDGLRDLAEAGVEGVVVRALDAGGSPVGDATSDPHGEFRFAALPPGPLVFEAVVPPGFTAAAADQLAPGATVEESDEIDSDFRPLDRDARTARTEPVEPGTPAFDTIGLGLVPAPDPATTTSAPPESTTSTVATTTTTTVLTTTTTTMPATVPTTVPATVTLPPATAPPSSAVSTTVAPTSTASPTSTTAPPG